MQDAERRLKIVAERKRSARALGGVARGDSMRKLSSGSSAASSDGIAAGAATAVLELATDTVGGSRRGSSQVPSVLTASLASFATEGLAAGLDDDDDNNSDASPDVDVSALSSEAAQRVDDPGDDSEDVESAKHHSLELQVEMLRGKLARRNVIIEVIRRAYYHDVIIVKEELRQGKLGLPSTSAGVGSGSGSHSQQGVNDRLAAVPSVDLRDALPLFAPSETVLQVHPCETCGGHLELVHGESKELQAARLEMAHASKGEQQMRDMVHRMRSEAKEMEEVHDALQQRVKALTKENSYALEQLQAARKAERDQKASIATLRAKLQLAHATQDEVDRLATEFKDVKQQLIRSNHDRDIVSASNNHLKDELAEVTKALHQTKVEKAQIESDFGTTYYRLQEEIKKSKQIADDLAAHQQQLQDKTTLSDELQTSLVSLKDELATALLRFEQTKRYLEDQLIEEERTREEMQEQNLEFRKTNKRLVKELEAVQRNPTKALEGVTAKGASSSISDSGSQHPSSVSPAELKGIMRKRLDDLQRQLEWSQMRENDLLAILRHQDAARAVEQARPTPVRHMLSRMPSTTVITRFVPNAEGEVAKATAGLDGSTRDSGSAGLKKRGGAHAPGASSRLVSNSSEGGDGDDGESEQDSFDDGEFGDSEMLEIDEKNFEAYHQEVHRMLTEIEEERSKSQKQQKTITDMERKHQALLEQLEEDKLTIEALTGSVNALKMRLNQDSAGAAEELEAMLRQLEDGKRDKLYEAEKTTVLKEALRSISDKVFELSDNQLLKTDIVVDFPNLDDDRLSASTYGGGGTASSSNDSSSGGHDGSDAHIVPDLHRKKQELRRKVLMEKEMKKFHQMCHSRSEIVNLELRKLCEVLESAREELDDAENKIDSDQLQLRTLDAEIAKLQLTVEMGKNSLQRTEKALKTTTEDLQDALKSGEGQRHELDALRVEHNKLQEDQTRVTMMLFEKTKAWEKEINTNAKHNLKITTLEASLLAMTAARDALHGKLQDIEELAEYRRRTNRSVEVSAVTATTECEMQTDRWKPHGLILRQRNSPESMPQRFLGKASVLIACPEFSASSANQEVNSAGPGSGITPLLDPTEHRRELLEFKVYPPAKAGGRQIKTSHGSSRPKALSRLFLSSDGISQKYISPSPRQAFHDTDGDASPSPRPSALFQDVQQRVRPFTSQS